MNNQWKDKWVIDEANEALSHASSNEDLSSEQIDTIINAYHQADARLTVKKPMPIPGWLGGKV